MKDETDTDLSLVYLDSDGQVNSNVERGPPSTHAGVCACVVGGMGWGGGGAGRFWLCCWWWWWWCEGARGARSPACTHWGERAGLVEAASGWHQHQVVSAPGASPQGRLLDSTLWCSWQRSAAPALRNWPHAGPGCQALSLKKWHNALCRPRLCRHQRWGLAHDHPLHLCQRHQGLHPVHRRQVGRAASVHGIYRACMGYTFAHCTSLFIARHHGTCDAVGQNLPLRALGWLAGGWLPKMLHTALLHVVRQQARAHLLDSCATPTCSTTAPPSHPSRPTPPCPAPPRPTLPYCGPRCREVGSLTANNTQPGAAGPGEGATGGDPVLTTDFIVLCARSDLDPERYWGGVPEGKAVSVWVGGGEWGLVWVVGGWGRFGGCTA